MLCCAVPCLCAQGDAKATAAGGPMGMAAALALLGVGTDVATSNGGSKKHKKKHKI